jgi:hypothetical protein
LKVKMFKIVGLTMLLAVGVLYGMCVVLYQLPPYSILRLAVTKKNQKQFYEIPKEALETDVEKLISITQPEDISRLRTELITFLWGTPKLPASMPSKVVKGFKDERYSDISSLSRIDKLSVVMEFGLESNVYHFIPKTPNNKIFLFHHGHGGDFQDTKEIFIKLLDSGYSVMEFSMPLIDPNNKVTIYSKRLGKLKIINHDLMKFLNPKKGHPLKYFLEPVINVLNYLKINFNYSSVSMIGLSGGGWTTTLVPAIDPRIENSFPVAGTSPIYLTSSNENGWGDYEQTVPELYRIANYLELYILGSYGTNRRQVQVLNQFDIAHFAGIRWKTYESIVASRVRKLGLGKFEVLSDTSHKDHKISKMVMNWILGQLNNSNL